MGWKDRATKVEAEPSAESPAQKSSWRDRAEPIVEGGPMDRLKSLFSSEGRDKIRAAADQRSAQDFASQERQGAAGTGLAQTELEQGANALTLGYLPQIEAGVSSAMGDDYVGARDKNIKRLEAQQSEHPLPSAAGAVGGGLLSSYLLPVPQVFKGSGILSKAAQGALTGGAMGAAVNPGDKEGVVDPIQADERIENAKHGAKFGAAVSGGAAAGQSVARGVQKLAKGMKGAAEGAAFKSSGAMLKDFREAFGKDELHDIGRFMLDKGIVKAGDTYETVAQKADAINEDAGKRLDDIYSKAATALPTKESVDIGLNLVRDKDAILAAASKDLGNAEGKDGALKRLGKYLDERAKELGSNTLPPRQANDIKTAIDKTINYSRNPMTKEPTAETAFSAARKLIAGKIDKQVDHIGKFLDNPDLAASLKEANRDYGYSKQINRVAADRLNRVSANNHFGLSDRMAGGAGAVAAAVASSAGGERDPLEVGLTAGGAGLLAMGANHVAQRYGNGVMAAGLNRMAPTTERAGQALDLGARGLLSQPVQRTLLQQDMKKRGLIKGLVTNDDK